MCLMYALNNWNIPEFSLILHNKAVLEAGNKMQDCLLQLFNDIIWLQIDFWVWMVINNYHILLPWTLPVIHNNKGLMLRTTCRENIICHHIFFHKSADNLLFSVTDNVLICGVKKYVLKTKTSFKYCTFMCIIPFLKLIFLNNLMLPHDVALFIFSIQ